MSIDKKLTKKQEAFVDLMVYQDYNQTKCAHLAGYENPGVAATRLLSDQQYVHVQEKKSKSRSKDEMNPDSRFTSRNVATHLFDGI